MQSTPSVDVLEKGKSLILQEKYDDALKYFKELSDKDNKNAIYSNYIGVIYFLKNDYKNAADSFKKAIELDPNNWYPYHKLGQICVVKKIDQCAIKYFTETIEKNPKNSYAFINLALIFRNEDENLTLDLIKSALGMDPLNLVGNYLLGTIYLKNKDYKNAENILTNITLQNPQFFMAWYKLAVLYFDRNKLKKAIGALDQALKISQKGFVYNLYGLVLVRKLKFEEAVSYFKEAIKLDPQDPSPWINLAMAYEKGKKIESSKLCLKEALKITKNESQNLAIWTNFANCYEQENRLPYALYCFQKAEEQSKNKEGEEIESYYESESKMEFIHKISQNIDRLKKMGITAQKPDDLDE